MKTRIIAAGVAASMALAAAALAQPAPGPRGPGALPAPTPPAPARTARVGPGWRRMMNPEDRAAMTDARIAGLKAMLRLTPDQERHWPP